MIYQLETYNPRDWHPWYAWHPVITEDNQWCWLESIQRRWETECNYVIDSSGYGDYNGGWKYKL